MFHPHRMEIDAYDQHSGIYSIVWDLHDMLNPSVSLASGALAAEKPKVNRSFWLNNKQLWSLMIGIQWRKARKGWILFSITPLKDAYCEQGQHYTIPSGTFYCKTLILNLEGMVEIDEVRHDYDYRFVFTVTNNAMHKTVSEYKVWSVSWCVLNKEKTFK